MLLLHMHVLYKALYSNRVRVTHNSNPSRFFYEGITWRFQVAFTGAIIGWKNVSQVYVHKICNIQNYNIYVGTLLRIF